MVEQIPAIPSGVYSSGVLAGKKKSTAAQKTASAKKAASDQSMPQYWLNKIATIKSRLASTKKKTPKKRYQLAVKSYERQLEIANKKLKSVGG